MSDAPNAEENLSKDFEDALDNAKTFALSLKLLPVCAVACAAGFHWQESMPDWLDIPSAAAFISVAFLMLAAAYFGAADSLRCDACGYRLLKNKDFQNTGACKSCGKIHLPPFAPKYGLLLPTLAASRPLNP